MGISQDERLMKGNKKIDQVDSFTYLSSIIGKDGGNNKDVKSRITTDQGIFNS